ncbi:MAG: ATP-binding cassette domain-containing protein [Alphaproteobacteria bacterium]|nr:ATP-binding cassette domain-containing protein [Alphaproteobacteria bacterium]
MSEAVIRVRGLRTKLSGKEIHKDLDLEVRKGEILGIVGGSGTGKSVLMRTILGLIRPRAGTIEVLGRKVDPVDRETMLSLERRWGVLFQDGALFSSLTVGENVQVPMREHLKLPPVLADQLAMLKIRLAGLKPEDANKFPSELSGGMRKRAALARALALDPDIVFLDEPTAGLDPVGAAQFDALLKSLSRSLGFTVFLITHDLDTLYAVTDRIAVLADKKVLVTAPIAELERHPHPWIQEYFHGPRGRAAKASAIVPATS